MNPVVQSIKRFFSGNHALAQVDADSVDSKPINFPAIDFPSSKADSSPVTVKNFHVKTLKSVYDSSGLKTTRFLLTSDLYVKLVSKDKDLINLVRNMSSTFNQRIILSYRDKEIFVALPKK